ncbi:molybdopterin-guanine dinucleotide biosynthesis protein B [Paenibacillus vini]|uniref:molybdopterin-guanine dinucleotide biosynthesis protein B n=1 Tax=Paenibacillus vini TaxID=1476024 RepID=UPI0025B6630C|nr:molybdopterin-guanine dinucleotide biosynthesis protein B [Paenibacillus vini]MDN4070375.1 molybdopterin-guanine dinucleotide biosynthesis protein B [Paenibacillus vini]
MKQVIQICGYKNSGKTTLIAGLVTFFKGMGLQTAVIKHDVHGFEGDVEATDTYKLRKAGATATAITSPWRTAVVEERETPLAELVEQFHSYDLILVEGFKQADYPKVVMLHQPEDVELITQLSGIVALICRRDAGIEALRDRTSNLASDPLLSEGQELPSFSADELEHIADFILKHVKAQ